MQNDEKERNLLKPYQAANLINLSLRRFWFKVFQGEIPFHIWGATIRFDEKEILKVGKNNAKKYLLKKQNKVKENPDENR